MRSQLSLAGLTFTKKLHQPCLCRRCRLGNLHQLVSVERFRSFSRNADHTTIARNAKTAMPVRSALRGSPLPGYDLTDRLRLQKIFCNAQAPHRVTPFA